MQSRPPWQRTHAQGTRQRKRRLTREGRAVGRMVGIWMLVSSHGHGAWLNPRHHHDWRPTVRNSQFCRLFRRVQHTPTGRARAGRKRQRRPAHARSAAVARKQVSIVSCRASGAGEGCYGPVGQGCMVQSHCMLALQHTRKVEDVGIMAALVCVLTSR